MKFQLNREQKLKCDLNTAWGFFSSPVNLSTITPKDLGFKVLSNHGDSPIYEGMIIDYKVSPLFNIPLKWRTRISKVDNPKSFTDFQEKGPYQYWEHRHEFIPVDGGVLMKDRVTYSLPLGIFGRLAHRMLVKPRLEAIFNYRYQVLEKKFNQ